MEQPPKGKSVLRDPAGSARTTNARGRGAPRAGRRSANQVHAESSGRGGIAAQVHGNIRCGRDGAAIAARCR